MPLPKPQANNRKARKLAERRNSKSPALNAALGLELADKASTKKHISDGVPAVSDLDCAFPCRWRELLPPWGDLTKEEQNQRGPFCEAVQSLFFKGGKLSDFGITPKPGIELLSVMRYLRATMGDFGPEHEHKIGGIGHMLAKWCDHK